MEKMSDIMETNGKLKNMLSRKDFIKDLELNPEKNKKYIEVNSCPLTNLREKLILQTLDEGEKVLKFEDFFTQKRNY